MNPAKQRKRTELSGFIQQEVTPEMSVQGVVVIDSVAKGIARADSEIDAVVFLDPFDLYAILAEFQWRPEDGTFHGIFSGVENSINLPLSGSTYKSGQNQRMCGQNRPVLN